MAFRFERRNALTRRAVVFSSILLLLFAAPEISAADHPPIVAGTRCSSCHIDKTRGKSVHAALAISCMVCHIANAQGNAITLTAPKEKLCFGCHPRTIEEDQHTPRVTGECVTCHDSHSSARPMLLLRRTPKAHQR